MDSFPILKLIISFIYDVHRDYMKRKKLKPILTNLEFQIQFQIFRLTWRVSHETLFEPMNAKIKSETGRIDDIFPDTEVSWTSVWNLLCSLSLSTLYPFQW